MDELRKIRDENSLRHLSQTPEEFSKEMKDSVSWFIKALGKPIEIVDKSREYDEVRPDDFYYINLAEQEYVNGETTSHNDIDWN